MGIQEVGVAFLINTIMVKESYGPTGVHEMLKPKKKYENSGTIYLNTLVRVIVALSNFVTLNMWPAMR